MLLPSAQNTHVTSLQTCPRSIASMEKPSSPLTSSCNRFNNTPKVYAKIRYFWRLYTAYFPNFLYNLSIKFIRIIFLFFPILRQRYVYYKYLTCFLSMYPPYFIKNLYIPKKRIKKLSRYEIC